MGIIKAAGIQPEQRSQCRRGYGFIRSVSNWPGIPSSPSGGSRVRGSDLDLLNENSQALSPRRRHHHRPLPRAGGVVCTTMLADYGAQVIKVEPPTGDIARGWVSPVAGGETAYFVSLHRNKRGIVLDLKRRRAGMFFQAGRKADRGDRELPGRRVTHGPRLRAGAQAQPRHHLLLDLGFGQDGTIPRLRATRSPPQAESGRRVTARAGHHWHARRRVDRRSHRRHVLGLLDHARAACKEQTASASTSMSRCSKD